MTLVAVDVALGDVARVDAGRLDLPVHLDELVLHDLAGDQRLAEGLALPAVRRGQGQRASGDAVGVYGEGDPLDHELLGDQVEAGVLLADEVRRRHPHVDERQLCGVRAVPAHLGQAAVDGEPGRALLDDEQADAGMTGATGADGSRDEVGAYAAGDERLAAVDDVAVTVAYGGRPDARDVGAAARLGDRERADLLAGQRRPHERVDLLAACRAPPCAAARCRR